SQATLARERAQPLYRRRRKEMDDGEIEERPRWQLPLGHRISVTESIHVRPVLLGGGARRLAVASRLSERDWTAERIREDLFQVGLLAGHDCPIGHRQSDRW